MHRVFLDAEFTQFRDGRLLALGLVSEDGRECYVEIDDAARHARASDFCKDTVIPQFGLVPGAGMPDDATAGGPVADWLVSLAAPLAVCHDYKLDWHFLQVALRAAGRWDGLAETLHAQDIAGVAQPGSAGEAAQDAVFEASRWPTRHHALVDARALRAAWLATFTPSAS